MRPVLRRDCSFNYLWYLYVQGNVGWGLDFSVPSTWSCCSCSLLIFLFGTRTYRLYESGDTGGAFFSVGKAIGVEEELVTRSYIIYAGT
ncbi:hypothetical protein PR202_gb22998 [Eleusine coracana subsp. coracana]|uniref:Uncharacterized protein n=1 Tax=Eleusine coracana subsp. coracana TaxID=191504 RepID=A0AAV5FIA9_ELECO|nr:hypothetical protein PR202_gb22998 [Eleusine coracana subsp. coracana]